MMPRWRMETVQRVMSKEMWSWQRREPITQLSHSSSRALGTITEIVKEIVLVGRVGAYFYRIL